jgi:hypothetical protein
MDAVCCCHPIHQAGKLDVGGAAANAELGYRLRRGVRGTAPSRRRWQTIARRPWAAHAQVCALPLPGSYEACDESEPENMSGRSDIEHLQELVVQLSPEDAELINRLERARLTLEFMLAGIRRPTTHEEIEHEGARQNK